MKRLSRSSIGSTGELGGDAFETQVAGCWMTSLGAPLMLNDSEVWTRA